MDSARKTGTEEMQNKSPATKHKVMLTMMKMNRKIHTIYIKKN